MERVEGPLPLAFGSALMTRFPTVEIGSAKLFISKGLVNPFVKRRLGMENSEVSPCSDAFLY